MAAADDQTPLVQQEEGPGGLTRETLMDKLLDRTGYGFFHVLLVLGKTTSVLWREEVVCLAVAYVFTNVVMGANCVAKVCESAQFTSEHSNASFGMTWSDFPRRIAVSTVLVRISIVVRVPPVLPNFWK